MLRRDAELMPKEAAKRSTLAERSKTIRLPATEAALIHARDTQG